MKEEHVGAHGGEAGKGFQQITKAPDEKGARHRRGNKDLLYMAGLGGTLAQGHR